jgi:hypothetical protein
MAAVPIRFLASLTKSLSQGIYRLVMVRRHIPHRR